ncbi:diaminopimelate epimerase [mine drainage metagenome]|uniref:diaminopimelate epimerase n=1 Tax=mine drainage metagenome TaxID=410659 RepID=T1BTN0_9ZZZZ
MHGLGNDFVIFHGAVTLTPQAIQRIADRRQGIGCDQILLLHDLSPGVFQYRVFNADGSEAEQCGNGLRCLARLAYDLGAPEDAELHFEGTGGIHLAHRVDRERIRVGMGIPMLDPHSIPFEALARAVSYPIDVSGMEFTVGAVSMGNPHLLLRVQHLETAPVAKIGPALENHTRCPARANIGFVEVHSRHLIHLRVHERGSGETLACGSGACAAVVWGHLMGWLDPKVAVHLAGGALEVEWAGEGAPVYMTGPATPVFSGEIEP